MAISKSRYVLITSGVGGQAAVGRRELIARVFTTNQLAPMGGVLEFGGGASSALKNVGAYFGTTSPEYAFANKYFSFISKDVRQADKISFARYSLNATAPQLISTEVGQLSQLTAVTDGSLNLSMGGVTYQLTGLDFSSATSYSAVATALQTAIQNYAAGGALWTGATVTFNNSKFILTGGSEGKASITAALPATSGTDVSSMLGWASATNPVVSVGTDEQTLTESLAETANASDNFGSFAFVEDMTSAQITEVAQWVNNQNVAFLYSVKVTPTNAQEVAAAVYGLNGVCLTLDANNGNAEYMPMAIGACIDYNRPNAATNFMFNKFDSDIPSVTTDTDADKYDQLRVNYLGATQQAGKSLAFYQRGVLTGDISDIGVYWNEMWLKDAFTTEFMNLLLALKMLPANADGANTARGVMIPVIEDAKNNGVIQAGKELSSVQKAYITSLTNNVDAWRSVEQNGWYLDVEVESYTNSNSGLTEYKINYQLIYGKGDAIKQVVGTDILI